jgi:hypothetical protein
MRIAKRLALAVAVMVGAIGVVSAAPAELAGTWVGAIDTDRGGMQIRLELVEKQGKWSGQIESAHGGWTVTSVTEKDGAWTVEFKTDGGTGRLSGRIADGRFTGKWDNAPQAVGTFSLTRAKQK